MTYVVVALGPVSEENNPVARPLDDDICWTLFFLFSWTTSA